MTAHTPPDIAARKMPSFKAVDMRDPRSNIAGTNLMWAMLALATAVFLATSLSKANAQQTPSLETQTGPIEIEQIATFDRPWGMAFLSRTQLLVTERTGGLWLLDTASGEKTAVKNPPSAHVAGQGGLLDVALHPDFSQTNWVYFTLARQSEGGTGTTLVRAKLSGLETGSPTLSDQQTLYEVLPSAGTYHYGSRIAFTADGNLYVTFGDHGVRPRAQDATNASGSVIRLTDDGSIPDDNPSFGANAKEGLWSIGHRNPQGAAIHPETGQLWTVEHGARGGDEINRPEAGKNYGWPTISYGRHYSGGRIGEGTQKAGMEQPIHYWDPSIAPSGLAFYDGDLFPDWKGNLFVGALKDQKLVRLTLEGNRVTHEEILLERLYGRIRDVRSGPDGALWLLTDSSRGALLRITPAR
ncbi:PQQ-dependent sugar dehydrogenase [Cohaesibacter sp. CAU 1516]|uniref:PQQ-dependent sugar dehydrogenase n=1 Tax=Cohaesibacter sp. CAU 1516 TaxID=2576038 RepID=UPI001FEF2718|nr:PQQ-dependent sugar dehydrogenase [Cohaesibacter sp. CAU 1516]